MTVLELVEFLKKQDPDMLVLVDDSEFAMRKAGAQTLEVVEYGNGSDVYDRPSMQGSYPSVPLTKAVLIS